MKDYEQHLEKYKHNRDFVRYGLNPSKVNCDDWEIVADFYACIHLIEAILHKECGEEVINHSDRTRFMEANPIIFRKSIRIWYKDLSSLAHTARYKYLCLLEPNDALRAQELLEKIEFELKDYIA